MAEKAWAVLIAVTRDRQFVFRFGEGTGNLSFGLEKGQAIKKITGEQSKKGQANSNKVDWAELDFRKFQRISSPRVFL